MKTEMNFDDATLMAYADGELDEAMRATLDKAIVANPELAARVAGHSALRDRLRNAYDPVLSEPVPEQWVQQIRTAAVKLPSARVVTLDERRHEKRTIRRWAWPEWGAMAASVALGLGLGQQILQPAAPVVARNGGLYAQGSLAAALSDQLAGMQTESDAVQLGISFRNRDGGYCRSFRIAAGTAGLACQQESGWHVKVLTEAEMASAGPGNYRLAATSLPPAVLSAVEATIEGEPLDADQEAAARKAGWR